MNSPEQVLTAIPAKRKQSENIIISWFVWHFLKMPGFLLTVWQNYISFGLDFFSVPLLISTLFSPWRHYRWSYSKNIIAYPGIFISNTFSRVLGAVCRSILIVFGIIFLAIILVIGFLVFISWFLIPFLFAALVYIFLYVI